MSGSGNIRFFLSWIMLLIQHRGHREGRGRRKIIPENVFGVEYPGKSSFIVIIK